MEHRFSFRAGDREVAFSGDRDFVEAQIARWAASWGAGPGADADAEVLGRVAAPLVEAVDPFPRVSPSFKPRRTVGLADFVALKEAVSPVDLLVVTGYYMEKYLESADYAESDLAAQLAQLPAWACQETHDVLELAVVQGWLQKLPNARYTLSYKGQSYVREGLA